MSESNIKNEIPAQKRGSKTDTHYSVTLDNSNESKELFGIVKEKLQDINYWHQLGGEASAIFQLTDKDGNDVARKVQIGDHFKIKVPAPGNEAGEGHDWVAVENIDDKSNSEGDSEAFIISVRPSVNPLKTDPEIAHFFTEDATSSFAVQREFNKVTASVHGRNESPNTETEEILDKARNALIALGAMAGLSNPQWKSLVKGIIEAGKTDLFQK